jgi:hypothetical protein
MRLLSLGRHRKLTRMGRRTATKERSILIITLMGGCRIPIARSAAGLLPKKPPEMPSVRIVT